MVTLRGAAFAETRRAWRVLETSHPPVYYIPLADVSGMLERSGGRSGLCEWKRPASYLDTLAGDRLRARG